MFLKKHFFWEASGAGSSKWLWPFIYLLHFSNQFETLHFISLNLFSFYCWELRAGSFIRHKDVKSLFHACIAVLDQSPAVYIWVVQILICCTVDDNIQNVHKSWVWTWTLLLSNDKYFLLYLFHTHITIIKHFQKGETQGIIVINRKEINVLL